MNTPPSESPIPSQAAPGEAAPEQDAPGVGAEYSNSQEIVLAHEGSTIDMNIPAATNSSAEDAPGEFASHILALSSDKSKKRHGTPLIEILRKMPPLHEPKSRKTNDWNERMLDRRPANRESALIQIVGSAPEVECDSCKKGRGRWNKCLIVPGLENDVTACGNCHWEAHDDRCNFYRPPKDEDDSDSILRGHRRSSRLDIEQKTDNLAEERMSEIVNGLSALLGQIQDAETSIHMRFTEIRAMLADHNSRLEAAGIEPIILPIIDFPEFSDLLEAVGRLTARARAGRRDTI